MADEFDDLPPLGGDGNQEQQDQGGQKHDPVDEEGSKLDKLLDDHIKETNRDGERQQDARQTPRDQNKDAQHDARSQVRPQDQQRQQDRRQQDDDRRGQGTDQRSQHGSRSFTPRQIGIFKLGADGALYDSNNNRVFNSGTASRIAQQASKYYEPLVREHAQLKTQVETLTNANDAARRAGLGIEEQALGLQLVSAWKKDKLQTINFLLNEATKSGIDVSSVRAGGVDMSALESVLEAKINAALGKFDPIFQQFESVRERNEIAEQVQNQIDEFYEENPDARPHHNILGAIMQEKGYTQREAWFALQTGAAQNGWDLSKPLGPQAQATRQRQGNGAEPTGDGNSRRLPPMNGRGANARGEGDERTVRRGSNQAFAADESWDNIVADITGLER